MGAPTVTARIVPTGYRMDDGGPGSTIALSGNNSINFWEKTLNPPGVDGGEPIPTSTQLNSQWRTMAPRALKTLTPLKIKAAYDPDVYTAILAQCNVQQAMTYHFPTGDAISFYGFLQKFEPDAMEEGKQPEADITIVPTNTDPSTRAEAAPVYSPAAGT